MDKQSESLWLKIVRFPIRAVQVSIAGLGRVSQAFELWLRSLRIRSSTLEEMASRGDSLATRWGSWLLAPFRWLISSAGSLADLTQAHPQQSTARRWLRWLFYPLAAFIGFANAVATTRRRELFWWTLPLVLIALPILILVLQTSLRSNREIASRYRSALMNAIQQRDFTHAELYQEKLIQLGSKTNRLVGERVNALLADGKTDEAAAVIMDLAPLDQVGDPQAHLWLAENLLSGSIQGNGGSPLEQARKHIELASKILPPEFSQLEYLRGWLAILDDDLPAATKRLDKLSSEYLPAAILKLRVDMELGNEIEAKWTAKNFLELLAQDQEETLARATPTFYALWYNAEHLTGKIESAIEVLLQWRQRFPEDKQVSPLLQASTIAALHRYSLELETIDLDTVLLGINEMGEVMDNDVRVEVQDSLDRVQRLSGGPEMDAWIDRLKKSEQLPSCVLEYFGTRALLAEDYGTARQFLQRAVYQNPSDQIAWNNLAFLLHSSFPGETQAALRAANQAVELMPDDGNARETRGMILLTLERYDDAIVDLELALNVRPDSRQALRGIVRAFRETGNKNRAAFYESQLN
ncbi:MAG: hypothetical protein R3C03_07480 [Pirellulaceae bacterium]